jgi:hypothetical protein
MISLRDAWGFPSESTSWSSHRGQKKTSPRAMVLAGRSGPNERAARMLELAAADIG